MIKLEINFSQEYEVQRVSETLQRLSFYKEKKYLVRLPENSSLDSEEQIKKAVEAEYDETEYKIHKTFIDANWGKLMSEISSEIAETNLKPREVYIINLTKYGVGGSYHYPDTVIANIKNSYNIGLLRSILHEILHLTIHPWITEYKVSHWEKERLVDLLLTKIIPRLSKLQQIPIDTREIDEIFSGDYPDIEKIIKKVGSLK